jgi:hypothetical protein
MHSLVVLVANEIVGRIKHHWGALNPSMICRLRSGDENTHENPESCIPFVQVEAFMITNNYVKIVDKDYLATFEHNVTKVMHDTALAIIRKI